MVNKSGESTRKTEKQMFVYNFNKIISITMINQNNNNEAKQMLQLEIIVPLIYRVVGGINMHFYHNTLCYCARYDWLRFSVYWMRFHNISDDSNDDDVSRITSTYSSNCVLNAYIRTHPSWWYINIEYWCRFSFVVNISHFFVTFQDFL